MEEFGVFLFFFSVRNLNLAKKFLVCFTQELMFHFFGSDLSIYELAFKNGSLRYLNTRDFYALQGNECACLSQTPMGKAHSASRWCL